MQQEQGGILGLSTIRRNRGISLEQIAESTKISIRSLKAIEGGDFHKLPGGIYTTSYLKQYAKAIDFDEAELLAFYQAQAGTAAEAAEDSCGNSKNLMGGGGFRPASILGWTKVLH
jgi:cytoskeletal protein RodZ